MFRVSEGFKIQSGLINRKEYAALDHKIQQIKWINNPLKRIFKIHQLQLKQASSIEVTSKKSIRVPGIKLEKIKDVISYLLGDGVDYQKLKIYHIERDYLMRNVLYFGITPWLIIGGLGWYLSNSTYFLLVFLMIPYMVTSIYVAFRKWKYGISDKILYTHNGIFENKNNILQLHKVQNVKILQSPYQWRRDLANLKIHTAAGSIDIPYIKLKTAIKIKDYLLYKVELNHEKWY
jgi:putative membrane protein